MAAHTKQIQFAWLDANMYNEDNSELLKKMRGINSHCMEFTEEDECLRFLGRGVGDPRRFIFIVSGQFGEKLRSDLYERENILSVYVYCGWKEKHEKWAKQYKKAKVVTTHDELLNGLISDRERYEKK